MHVVILGGGIAGLAAALHLSDSTRERTTSLRVTLVESGARLGGCIETRSDDGYLIELGAESLPLEKPWAIALLDRLGMRGDLLEPCAQRKGTLLLRGHRLRRLPESFSLMLPRSLLSLAASGVLSPAGIARAAMEPFVPARIEHGDESLASFVTRRLGREALERIAQPLLGGIYSADPARLSMQATLPQALEMERAFGSLTRAMRAARPQAGTHLVTLRAGLGTVVDRIVTRLHGIEILHGEAISAQPAVIGTETRWRVTLANTAALDADALICALPAPAAARLFTLADAKLAALLQSVRYNSLAVVTLAYRRSDVRRLPRAHGLLVPFVAMKHVTAVTFSSSKYAGRAPEDRILLRAYLGGALQSALLERDDERLAAMVRDDLRHMLAVDAAPCLAVVRRWNEALPEYAVGHLERVAEMERRATSLPRLALAGAAYRGVGVSDCVRSGESAAQRVAEMLAAHDHAGT